MSNITSFVGHAPAKDRVAFWRGTLAAYGGSGRSVRQFCQERGLRESAFYFWRRTIARRDGLAAAPPRKPALAFVPLRVEPRPVFPAPPTGGESFQVELRGGRVLRLPASMPAGRLAEVLHALEGQTGMIGTTHPVQIWVATAPVDMRKSFDGLAEHVRAFLGRDPLCGHMFVFRNRTGRATEDPLVGPATAWPSTTSGWRKALSASPVPIEKCLTLEASQLLQLLAGKPVILQAAAG